MRSICCLFSFLLHAVLLGVLAHVTDFHLTEIPEVLTINLFTSESIKPKPIPVPQKVQAPSKKPSLPMNQTVILTDVPQPVPTATAAQQKTTSPEDVIKISPKKRATPQDLNENQPRPLFIRGDDGLAHRGAEAHFGRSLLGDYFSYPPEQFSGNFKVGNEDRVITIIDARKTKYGRFLIYDSRTKTLRRLKEFAKYVYTIGPSTDRDEPVVGSVTFLAKNDRIERFLLMTDDEEMAQVPNKLHVIEEECALACEQGKLDGLTTLPPSGTSPAGVVFVSGNRCVSMDLVHGITRSLGMRNISSLFFPPRGCKKNNAISSSDAELTQDIKTAFSSLAANPQVNKRRIGVWGHGLGVSTAIQSSTSMVGKKPAFLVCLLDESIAPRALPDRTQLAKLNMPVLWLITGRDTGAWQVLVAILENLRDVEKNPFTIVIAPTQANKKADKSMGNDLDWVEQATEDHVHLAASWILNLEK